MSAKKLLSANTKDKLLRPRFFDCGVEYSAKVKLDVAGHESGWSNKIKFVPSDFSECCTWKGCPDEVNDTRDYSTNKESPNAAVKTGNDCCCCTIIGNTPLPQNKVTSWSVKILNPKGNNGHGTYIRVAPSDID